MEEIWKAIPGHPGYEASTLGRIRSVDRMIKTNGRGTYFKKGQVLIHKKTNDGYLKASIERNKWTFVHRIVLTVFVGPRPPGHQACHNDGDQSNNAISNLRWDIPKNNVADRINHGTYQFGERNPRARLSADDVSRIINDKRKQKDIAKDFGISRPHVSVIKSGKIWGHLNIPKA
jgi:hypothetical protein